MRGGSLRILSRGRKVTDTVGFLKKKDCQAGKRTASGGKTKKCQKLHDVRPWQGSCLRVVCWERNRAWFPFWGSGSPQSKPTLFGFRPGDLLAGGRTLQQLSRPEYELTRGLSPGKSQTSVDMHGEFVVRVRTIPVHLSLLGMVHKPLAASRHRTTLCSLVPTVTGISSKPLAFPFPEEYKSTGRSRREKISQQNLESSVHFHGGKRALGTRHFLSWDCVKLGT